MRSRIRRLYFALAVLAYLYVGVRPHEAPPPPGNADLVYHALLNAALTALAYQAFPARKALQASLFALAALGGAIEIAQIWSPNREPSLADFAADLAGIALASGAFSALLARRRRARAD